MVGPSAGALRLGGLFVMRSSIDRLFVYNRQRAVSRVRCALMGHRHVSSFVVTELRHALECITPVREQGSAKLIYFSVSGNASVSFSIHTRGLVFIRCDAVIVLLCPRVELSSSLSSPNQPRRQRQRHLRQAGRVVTHRSFVALPIGYCVAITERALIVARIGGGGVTSATVGGYSSWVCRHHSAASFAWSARASAAPREVRLAACACVCVFACVSVSQSMVFSACSAGRGATLLYVCFGLSFCVWNWLVLVVLGSHSRRFCVSSPRLDEISTTRRLSDERIKRSRFQSAAVRATQPEVDLRQVAFEDELGHVPTERHFIRTAMHFANSGMLIDCVEVCVSVIDYPTRTLTSCTENQPFGCRVGVEVSSPDLLSEYSIPGHGAW